MEDRLLSGIFIEDQWNTHGVWNLNELFTENERNILVADSGLSTC